MLRLYCTLGSLGTNSFGIGPNMERPKSWYVFPLNAQRMEAKMEIQDLNQIVAQTDATLIASDKVQGVGVYRSTGERIGTVKHIMINKRTGQVAYAVMNFGGFLGMGEEGYPIA
jgi:PRC-barrel domain